MKITQCILSLLGATALAVAAQATLVTLNTSSLAGGTYYVDFQLNDGGGVGNGNNTASLYGFNFGGGAASGDIGAFGGVTGDLFSSLKLTDTDPFNEFYQSFTAGGFLSFNLNLSNQAESGGVPDLFSFALLDSNLFNLGTFSLGSDQFLTVDLTGGDLAFATYAGVDGVPAPHIPEAGSTALFAALGLLGLAGFRRRLVRVNAA